jgi:RimJ/RimL family protein N-acetyltransferase
MSRYAGPPLTLGAVRIAPPDLAELAEATPDPDVRRSVEYWLGAAARRADVGYFSVYRDAEVVGQILLHDVDLRSGESLVAYHIFREQDRGRGIMTSALTLLQRFAALHTPLTRLVVITSDDNRASQRVAEKCGFVYQGPSREDPAHGIVFAWTVRGDGRG